MPLQIRARSTFTILLLTLIALLVAFEDSAQAADRKVLVTAVNADQFTSTNLIVARQRVVCRRGEPGYIVQSRKAKRWSTFKRGALRKEQLKDLRALCRAVLHPTPVPTTRVMPTPTTPAVATPNPTPVSTATPRTSSSSSVSMSSSSSSSSQSSSSSSVSSQSSSSSNSSTSSSSSSASSSIISSTSSSSSTSMGCVAPEGFLKIESEAQLEAINSPRQNYFVCNDIVMTHPHAILFPRTEYLGVLDGGGHALIDLRVIQPNATSSGLFGLLGAGAVIRNLTLRNVQIEGGFAAGALAGLSEATLENVHVEDGTVTGSGSGWLGALVGFQGARTAPVNCSTRNVLNGSTDEILPLVGFSRP